MSLRGTATLLRANGADLQVGRGHVLRNYASQDGDITFLLENPNDLVTREIAHVHHEVLTAS